MLARNIHDEDTIELQLSATELELLSQAAAEAEAREAQAPGPQMRATPGEPAAPGVEAAPVAVPGIPAAIPAATIAAAETPPLPAVVPTASVAAAPVAKLAALRAVAIAPTLVPVAFPERTAHSAPRAPAVAPGAAPARPTERARGSLQLVPNAPPPTPAPSTGRPTPGRQTLRSIGRRVFRPSTFGVRTAAALVSVAVVIAIALWPRTPTPEPAVTPTTTPAPTGVQPVLGPLHEATPPAAAVGVTPPSTEPPVLRIQNPFDPTEVFEFPAGTAYVDARDQVAQLLITRARARNGMQDSSTSTVAPTNPPRTAGKASFAQQL